MSLYYKDPGTSPNLTGSNGTFTGTLSASLATFTNVTASTEVVGALYGTLVNTTNLTASSVVATQVSSSLFVGKRAALVRKVTASFTISLNDQSIWIDTTAGNVTASLQLANALGSGRSWQYELVKTNTGTNSISVLVSGSDTCNGLTGAQVLSGSTLPNFPGYTLESDGVSAIQIK